MSLVLHAAIGNFRGNAILAAADIVGVDITLKHIDYSDLNTAQHKARNPLGQIPVLETPNGYIYETNAVLRYVAQAGSKNIYGSSAFQKSKVDQWIDFVGTEVIPAIRALNLKVWGYANPSEEEVKNSREAFTKLAGFLNSSLNGAKFLVGDSLTIADIALFFAVVFGYRTFLSAEWRNAHSNLTAWFENVSQTPALVKYFGKTYYPAQTWF